MSGVHQQVCLVDVSAERLLDVDVLSGFQSSQRQRVVRHRRRYYYHELGVALPEHRVVVADLLGAFQLDVADRGDVIDVLLDRLGEVVFQEQVASTDECHLHAVRHGRHLL